MNPIINNILDTDQYKLSMQMAVGQLFPNAMARYTFINRGKTEFRPGFAAELRSQIETMDDITATPEQFDWLAKACPYLNSFYLDYLRGYRFDPKEVAITQDGDGGLSINVEGPWHRAILWEVPLLALVSELHFKDRPWGFQDVDDVAKFRTMEGLKFADFGTRRRFSGPNQWRVVKIAQKTCPDAFIGTSNVDLSYALQRPPVGTMAHEWISFHGAVYGYNNANWKALKDWAEVYKGDLGIALTDTYGTDCFFKGFLSDLAREYDGLRQDSGDPIQFAKDAKNFYERLCIDPASKILVFSDGLDSYRAINIHRWCKDNGLRCSFGIGTNLTNDVGVKPLNIVMKMTGCKLSRSCSWAPVVKLSDVAGKHTGDPAEVERAKQMVGYKPQSEGR